MPYNKDEFAYEATAIRGVAALKEMLDHIGRENSNGDHDVARVLVDNEMPLRALVTFALGAMHHTV